jgi:hypothetical protein
MESGGTAADIPPYHNARTGGQQSESLIAVPRSAAMQGLNLGLGLKPWPPNNNNWE